MNGFHYFCKHKRILRFSLYLLIWIMSEGFTFKRFTVSHGKCAMKVGTDGVLLGAWARGGRRILDVGTGSGLVALMMAQRFEDAEITAIDIEPGACLQARENVAASPFAGRIRVVETALQDFREGEYDAIVCNPPFYAGTLRSKSAIRRFTQAHCAARRRRGRWRAALRRCLSPTSSATPRGCWPMAARSRWSFRLLSVVTLMPRRRLRDFSLCALAV